MSDLLLQPVTFSESTNNDFWGSASVWICEHSVTLLILLIIIFLLQSKRYAPVLQPGVYRFDGSSSSGMITAKLYFPYFLQALLHGTPQNHLTGPQCFSIFYTSHITSNALSILLFVAIMKAISPVQ